MFCFVLNSMRLFNMNYELCFEQYEIVQYELLSI